MKSLSKNKNLITQELDNRNFIAIIDKSDYLKKMRNILSDSSKFTQVSVGEDKKLNFIGNVEKHITDLLKDFKALELFLKLFIKV